MSHAPERKGRPMTLTRLAEKKALGEPLAMVTAYDYPSAQVAEEAGVDLVLVGDSGAMTVLGYPTTVPVTVDELLMLAAAVRRGLDDPVPGRRPALRLLRGLRRAGHRHRAALHQGGGLRRGQARARRHLGAAGARRSPTPGIPVMGHVGLTPQTATALGGYRSQGRTAERALEVVRDAVALQDAGCFSIVFEAVPSALTELLMPRMEIPVIGIGAGGATDGQVLVFHDLLGHLRRARRPLRQALRERPRADDRGGVAPSPRTCATRRYPEPEHGYTMAPDEIERLQAAARAER